MTSYRSDSQRLPGRSLSAGWNSSGTLVRSWLRVRAWSSLCVWSGHCPFAPSVSGQLEVERALLTHSESLLSPCSATMDRRVLGNLLSLFQ